MTLRQTAKKNMYDKVQLFYNANTSVWAAFVPLVDAINRFTIKNDEMELDIKKQQQQTKGITSDKTAKQQNTATLIVRTARKARVYAHDTGNLVLEAIFDVRIDDFTHVPDQTGLARAKDVRDALHTHIGSLAPYNITPADITAIGNAITAFENAIGAPGQAGATKKLGTDGINAKMHDMDEELDVIDDLLVNEYSESNPAIADEYKNNRFIHSVGIHHTGIHAGITFDDGSGNAEGVTMKIVELNKTAISNINGIDEIMRCKAGTYHIEFSAPNIDTKTLILKINRGEILNVQVQVKKH